MSTPLSNKCYREAYSFFFPGLNFYKSLNFWFKVKHSIAINCSNFVALEIIIVWFQKISIPTPWKIIGNSEGEGGFKGSYFQGVGDVYGKLLFQRMTNHRHNIESNVQSIVSTKTYVRCFETKISTPGHWDEVNIISFNVSVFLWVS